jgi:hypothetical protein
MVQAIVPLLPAAVQGPLTQILNMVTATVGTIVPGVLSSHWADRHDPRLAAVRRPHVVFERGTVRPRRSAQRILASPLAEPAGQHRWDPRRPARRPVRRRLGRRHAPATGGIGAIPNSVTGLIGNLLGGLLGRSAPAT